MRQSEKTRALFSQAALNCRSSVRRRTIERLLAVLDEIYETSPQDFSLVNVQRGLSQKGVRLGLQALYNKSGAKYRNLVRQYLALNIPPEEMEVLRGETARDMEVDSVPALKARLRMSADELRYLRSENDALRQLLSGFGVSRDGALVPPEAKPLPVRPELPVGGDVSKMQVGLAAIGTIQLGISVERIREHGMEIEEDGGITLNGEYLFPQGFVFGIMSMLNVFVGKQ